MTARMHTVPQIGANAWSLHVHPKYRQAEATDKDGEAARVQPANYELSTHAKKQCRPWLHMPWFPAVMFAIE